MANDDPAKTSQEFFQMFTKAKEFTEEVLKENERLRFKVARLETAGGAPGGEERARELSVRVRDLEELIARLQDENDRLAQAAAVALLDLQPEELKEMQPV